jgi:glycosyltransferase involved in cell wall biosynthesis
MSYVKMDEKMEKPFRHYITVWKDEHLLPNRKMAKSATPKISIIIPMYNEEKNITPCIRSIQNQSEQEIEIVCVNDNSTDKTLSILQKLQKEDPRIEIITNKSNRGVIYNRIYGALQSKGEYVTFIDADDGLCNIDILSKAYNVATKEHGEKIDIVHYQTCACTIKDNGEMDPFVIFFTFNPNNFNQVIRQPEIGDNYMQKKNNITGSAFVFDKLYSRDLILRIGDYLGPNVWNQNLSFCDDFLLAFAAMKCAKSIVNIGKIGYWHFMDSYTSTTSNVWAMEGDKLKNPDKTNRDLGNYMIILSKMLDLTENEPESLEFRETICAKLLKDGYLECFARSLYFDTLINLFERLDNWKYATEDLKKRVKSYIKKILKHKYEPEKKSE